MRRLSEIKGEDAVDVLADLMSPVTAITSDEKIRKTWESKKKTMADFVTAIFKSHKDALVQVLCILDGSTRDEYLKNATVISIVQDAMYVMNDPVMKELFTGQSQKSVEENSGSATESADKEK